MIEDEVRKVIETIRPKLEIDGGGIDLISVGDDGTVTVKLTGACDSCPMSALTMQWTVEKLLKDTIPGVTKVIQG
jgi:Fe-S cluster biogenesis protein NfuA